MGGNVLNDLPLLRGLPPEQPVYGLQARGLVGHDMPLSSIDDMADLYLRDIRALQPQGPYLLGDGSMGGVVALEIARGLRAAGDDVALLVMFDTRAPGAAAARGPLSWHAVVPALRRPGRLALCLRRVEQAHRQALRGAAPRPYAGDVTLLRSAEPHPQGEMLGWQCWVDAEIFVPASPGSHEDFIEQSEATHRLHACMDAVLKPTGLP
ncbi:MAG: thioesterase domain-containing protein [Pseudoxanthomonas sp.]